MLAGNVEGLLALKSDEEVVRYLDHIYQFWASLFSQDMNALLKIRYHDIKKLEGRNPGNCLSDQEHLSELWRTGAVFGNFPSSQRRDVWIRLQNFHRRVPSLFLFFQDYKYLEALVESVKKIIPPKRKSTMRQVLADSFHKDSRRNDLGSPHFDHAYRKLYLFAMRHAKALSPKSVRLEAGEQKVQTEEDVHVFHDFAREARRLGFVSANIAGRLANSPDHEEARRALIRARDPRDFKYDEEEVESYVNQIAGFFAKAKKIEKTGPDLSLVRDGAGEEVKRRFGYPPTKSYEDSAQLLLLENMHMPDTAETGELTSFFVRRDVYLAFFGTLESEADQARSPSPDLDFVAESIAGDTDVMVSNSIVPFRHELPSESLAGPVPIDDHAHMAPSTMFASPNDLRSEEDFTSPSIYSQVSHSFATLDSSALSFCKCPHSSALHM